DVPRAVPRHRPGARGRAGRAARAPGRTDHRGQPSHLRKGTLLVTALDRAKAPTPSAAAPVARSPRRRGGPRLRRILTVHVPLLLLGGARSVPTSGLSVGSSRPGRAGFAPGGGGGVPPPLAFTEKNYVAVLTAGGMGRAFLNSLLITVPSVSLMVSIGTVAG